MIRLLLFLIAFSLPLGDQMNSVFGLNISLLYAIAVIPLLLYIPFKTEKDRTLLPSSLIIFYSFVTIYIFIDVLLIHPDFLSGRNVVKVWDKVVVDESHTSTLLRYILYFYSPLVLVFYINTKSSFMFFIKTFINGFLFSILLTLLLSVTGITPDRFSGGFHDPNTFGGYSLIVFFLSVFLYRHNRKSLYFKLTAIIAIACLIYSGSRSAALGIVFGILYLLTTKSLNLKEKRQVLIIIIVLATIVLTVGSEMITRFSIIDKSSGGGDLRVSIWLTYLSNIREYFWTGTGFGNIFEAFKHTELLNTRATHNQYLLQFVQFGIFGLILFCNMYFSLVFRLMKVSRRLHNLSYISAIFVSFCVLFFFSDYDNSREYTILISLFLALNSIYCQKDSKMSSVLKKVEKSIVD